jgi:hypothetical protein
MSNHISPALALMKVGLRTKQKSRRLVGWRKFAHRAVRYTMSVVMLFLFIKLFIYLAF